MINNKNFKYYCKKYKLRCKFGEEVIYRIDLNVDWLHKTFLKACYENYLETAKFLWYTTKAIGKEIDLQVSNNHLIKFAVHKNHVEIVDWIYNINHFNIHQENDIIFRYSSEHNNLDMAKWAYMHGATIEINNHEAFKKCCECKYYNMVKWMCSIYSDYSYVKLSNGNVIPRIKGKIIDENENIISIIETLKCNII